MKYTELKSMFKTGRSNAVVLPKVMLNILGWDENTQLKLETNGKRIIITKED